MINWYTDYDEINAELLEMAARSTAEILESTNTQAAARKDVDEVEPIRSVCCGMGGRLFVGSGEDICTWAMEHHFTREGTRYEHVGN